MKKFVLALLMLTFSTAMYVSCTPDKTVHDEYQDDIKKDEIKDTDI